LPHMCAPTQLMGQLVAPLAPEEWRAKKRGEQIEAPLRCGCWFSFAYVQKVSG